MAKHKLSLNFPVVLNSCVLPIFDLSVYNPDAVPTCPILEVTLPGFQNPVQITEPDIAPGFNINLTACDLEIQTENCNDTFNGLPDGIYILKYSVSPNETVFVEYNHLRITNALKCYKATLCDLNVGECEPDTDLARKLERLRTIRMYFAAAVATVENCHNPKKGMAIFQYALKQLKKFKCIACEE